MAGRVFRSRECEWERKKRLIEKRSIGRIQYAVLRVHNVSLDTARWLSWLERRPVTAEVDGSNPFRVVFLKKSIWMDSRVAKGDRL